MLFIAHVGRRLFQIFMYGMYYMLVYPGTTHTPTHTHTHTTRHSRISGINANKWKHKYFQRFVVRANLFALAMPKYICQRLGRRVNDGP